MISSLCHDALVVGGGPAGSTLAIALAAAGRQVVVVEKSREPEHKVCGEFLSPESLPLLRRIGIFPEQLGAQTIHSVRLVAQGVLAEMQLPAPALSLTRRTLDEALLQRAQQSGASVLRGYTAECLSHQPASGASRRWRAQIRDSAQTSIAVHGGDAFLATGKHDLRGWIRSRKGTQNNLVALKMYFSLSPEQQSKLAGYVEVIVYPGGYAGLQLVEDNRANLCVLVTREKLQSLGNKWDGLLDHLCGHSLHLARRLSAALPTLDRPLAASSIPYGYCAKDSVEGPSPWRLGDQVAVIPSFSGDGMSIALYTAQRAAQLYLGGATPAVFHAEVHRQFDRRLCFATQLSRSVIAIPALAQAARLWPSMLLEIFAATRIPEDAIRTASLLSQA